MSCNDHFVIEEGMMETMEIELAVARLEYEFQRTRIAVKYGATIASEIYGYAAASVAFHLHPELREVSDGQHS